MRRLVFFEAEPRRLPCDAGACVGTVLAAASPADLEAIAAVGGAAGSACAREYDWRLRHGHRLILARGSTHRPSAWGWLTLPRSQDELVLCEWRTRLRILPGEAYLWDFFTVPPARGRGLYAGLLRTALAYCAAEGAVTVRIFTRSGNEASRRGILAAGFRPTAPLLLARAGPLYAMQGPCGVRLLWATAPIPRDAVGRPRDR